MREVHIREVTLYNVNHFAFESEIAAPRKASLLASVGAKKSLPAGKCRCRGKPPCWQVSVPRKASLLASVGAEESLPAGKCRCRGKPPCWQVSVPRKASLLASVGVEKSLPAGKCQCRGKPRLSSALTLASSKANLLDLITYTHCLCLRVK